MEGACSSLLISVLLNDVCNDRLQRDDNGCFNDGDLAKILQDATQWPAGAFKARGTPEVLRVIEMMGIEQSREWGTCSVSWLALQRMSLIHF